MSRAEKAVRAQELRSQGKLFREIAAELGVSPTYAQELVSDPTGAAATKRRESYRRPCPVCGALMNGGDGYGKAAPKYCSRCGPSYSGNAYTAERVLALIREWTEQHGRPPSVPDWSKAHARQFLSKNPSPKKARQLIAALADGRQYPHPHVLTRLFGSWEAAIEAAGYTPRMRVRRSGEELLEMIRSASADGVAPPTQDFSSYWTVVNRFGSWSAACEAAGVVPRWEAIRRGLLRRKVAA